MKKYQNIMSMIVAKMEKKLNKRYPTDYNLLIAKDLW